MHFVDAKGILNSSGGSQGMNIYRGCSHGCIYCDGRSLCYQFTHPFEDIEVLAQMQERGIPTVVWLTPILPFLNDTEENITAILQECVRAGVKGIIDFGMGLTLRPGDREYYYAALDKYFPGMKRRYIRQYGDSYVLPSPNAAKLTGIFRRICEEHGILSDPDEVFRYMNELPEKYTQMSIFDL